MHRNLDGYGYLIGGSLHCRINMSSNRHRNLKQICFFLISIFHALTTLAADIPASIEGQWEVTEVHINTEATWTPIYQWNDPRLVGRLFLFKKNEILDNTPEGGQCSNSGSEPIKLSLNKIIEQSMADFGEPERDSNPEDYKIKLPSINSVEIIRLFCDQHPWHANLGKNDAVKGVWLAEFNDQILLRWYGESLLVLKKVQENHPPKSSFNCNKAHTKTEKTICNSYELSAFDRSVKASFDEARSHAKETSQGERNLNWSQRQWLTKRNQCVDNVVCLRNAMENRLHELAQESGH
jgi:uncharacterized protein YecT (DUF1311 family)